MQNVGIKKIAANDLKDNFWSNEFRQLVNIFTKVQLYTSIQIMTDQEGDR